MSTKFYFYGNQLEHTRSYTYLGVKFTISGSFTEATSDLYKKGLKALFKIRKCVEYYKPKLKTLIHIFDHTVKPVVLYGSDIWGTFLTKKLHVHGDNYFFNICKKFNFKSSSLIFANIYWV